MCSILRRCEAGQLPSVLLIFLALFTLLAGDAHSQQTVGASDEALYRCAQQALAKKPQDCLAAALCLEAYVDRNPDMLRYRWHEDAVFKSWDSCVDKLADALWERGLYLGCRDQLAGLEWAITNECSASAVDSYKSAVEKAATYTFEDPWPAPLLDDYPPPGAATASLLCRGGEGVILTYFSSSYLSTRPHILVDFAKAPGPALSMRPSGVAEWALRQGECAFEHRALLPDEPGVFLLRDPWLQPAEATISWTAQDQVRSLEMPAPAPFFMEERNAQFEVFNDNWGHWVITRMEPLYAVVLQSAGENEVEDVIEAVRAVTGLGFDAATDLVKRAPAFVLPAVSEAGAYDAAARLEAAGAAVEIKPPLAPRPPAPAGASEEQTEFDVILLDAGERKIKVITIVRSMRVDLGLTEAKNLVDSPPAAVLRAVCREEAANAKAKLEEAGATVEVK